MSHVPTHQLQLGPNRAQASTIWRILSFPFSLHNPASTASAYPLVPFPSAAIKHNTWQPDSKEIHRTGRRPCAVPASRWRGDPRILHSPGAKPLSAPRHDNSRLPCRQGATFQTPLTSLPHPQTAPGTTFPVARTTQTNSRRAALRAGCSSLCFAVIFLAGPEDLKSRKLLLLVVFRRKRTSHIRPVSTANFARVQPAAHTSPSVSHARLHTRPHSNFLTPIKISRRSHPATSASVRQKPPMYNPPCSHTFEYIPETGFPLSISQHGYPPGI